MSRPGQHPSLATTGRSGIRRSDELYPTPHDCLYPLFSRYQLEWPRQFWEPAGGDGRIVAVGQAFHKDGIATDLYDHSPETPLQAPVQAGIDFLATTEKRADLIVTNPPYDEDPKPGKITLSEKFVRHALALGVRDAVFFLPISYLGADRRENLHRAGAALRHVDVLIPRPTLYPLGAERQSSGAVVFAWFHFTSRPRRGPATIDTLRRDGT